MAENCTKAMVHIFLFPETLQNSCPVILKQDGKKNNSSAFNIQEIHISLPPRLKFAPF